STNVVTPNTNKTAAFNPNTTLSTTIRMVPFAGARTITVHFNTLTVGGRIVNNNTEITSTQSVQLKEGKSYTLKIQFKKGPGINVLEKDMNLTQNGCTAQDKKDLAQLIWADGNLKSTGSSNYVWGTSTEYGYYYTFYSTYTGNTSQNNTDPCTKLNASTYGTGWRTPSQNELTKLSRCTNKVMTNKGMWFMASSPKGLFLSAAGRSPSNLGSTTPPLPSGNWVDTYANYWTSDPYGNADGYALAFETNDCSVILRSRKFGCSVRCVKGNRK
ncbi:DUF1566 domain-containing protein, partial [Bacteroides fragilis]|nr:DUF1566 domain-containing protein [Bacteroides fragilis]